MDAARAVEDAGKKIDVLQREISAQPWESMARTGFVAALDKSTAELKDLRGYFANIAEELESEAAEGRPELKPFLEDFDKLLVLLEKNLVFEGEKKGSHAKTVNVLEKEESPGLYSDLEQRILATLLKGRYNIERLTIFLKRQGMQPVTDKSTAQQVMEVLHRKEDELQELRGKYEAIRKKSYMGYFEENTVADLEQELGEAGRKMALNADELGKSIGLNKERMEYMESNYTELKKKLDSLDGTFEKYSSKSEELIKALKKERDYAKKVALDVEHETLQLRNTYTHEMLNLQETKLAVKKEAEKKFGEGIVKLRKELAEKEGLAKHFKKVAEDKLRKEQELEEKVKKLTLLLKAKETHDAVKRQYKAKRKKK